MSILVVVVPEGSIGTLSAQTHYRSEGTGRRDTVTKAFCNGVDDLRRQTWSFSRGLSMYMHNNAYIILFNIIYMYALCIYALLCRMILMLVAASEGSNGTTPPYSGATQEGTDHHLLKHFVSE